MSFEYVGVKESDFKDFIQQLNYHGSKGYRRVNAWAIGGQFIAIMERMKGRR